MNRLFRNVLCTLALAATSTLLAAPAMAEDWPLVPGNFWDVTGIQVKDGGGLKYAQFLASEWRKNMDFAKSKGWIKSYMILSNNYPRKGEPDLYLITVSGSVPSAAESEARQKEYQAWRKQTIEQMQSESGNRAQYREVMSESLLQELNFRK